ncbi:MAG: hypothetical protein ACT4PL_14130 [Phycisphaerales bacterium]
MRNNIKAGMLVGSTIILATATTLLIANAWTWFMPKNRYVVRFSVREGAMGVKSDSEVRIGGQQVGRVEAVSFKRPDYAVDPNAAATKDADSEDRLVSRFVYVTVAVEKRLVIYRDAAVNLELPLLGSVSTINIPDVGGEKKGPDGKPIVLVENEIIDGGLAPPSFLAQAGYGDEQKRQLRDILEKGQSIAQQIETLIGDSRGPITTTLTNVATATGNVADTTTALKEKIPDWTAYVETALTNVRGASAEAQERLIEAKAVVAAVQSAIEDNRARIDSIVMYAEKSMANVEKATEKFNSELYKTVKQGIEEGAAALTEIRTATQKSNAFLDKQLPELELTMANMRLASDQLKLALIEIRRSPGRLLYQPKRREIEEELLYDSVRMYADAVSNLRSASQALENVTAASGTNPQAQRELPALTARLTEAFKEYEKASKAMLERVMEGEGAKGK